LVLERVRHPKKYFVQYIFNYSVLFLASISWVHEAVMICQLKWQVLFTDFL
jgi:hypothetical protein